jgi:CRISPR-associated protein Cmr2
MEMPRKPLREEWKELARVLHDAAESNHPHYRGLAAALSGEGNERLCAVCATKRFVQRFYFQADNVLSLRGGFPSTSSIASAVFRRDVLDKVPQAERGLFTDALGKIRDKAGRRIPETLSRDAFPPLSDKYAHDRLLEYDGDLFYPETYTAKRLQDDYGVDFDESALRQLQSAIRALRRAAADPKLEINPPPKYYAVMVMDGDHMGENLGKAQTLDEHRRISNALRDFALQHVQTIVEDQCLGRVVYAGGDDLMAFLPLEYVLDAARDLCQKFNDVSGLTLSAGIAIAHHLAPLDGVLSAAREAEKEKAKKQYGRNAVVFTVLKRSGEPLDVGARWQYGGLQTLELIKDVRDRFRGGGLSAKFAFDAEAESRAIDALGKIAHEKMLARLIKRHSPPGDDKLAGQLTALGEGLRAHLPADMPAALEVARWLLLARFLAAAQAGEE